MNRNASPTACKRIRQELEMALPASGLRPVQEGTAEAFLRNCYIDLLSRCPTPEELSEGLRELRQGKTREEYRYWLANTQAAKEACLNRPLVASLHAEMADQQRRLQRLPEAASCELIQLLYQPTDDRSARIQSLYQAILNRLPVQEEIDGWTRQQGRGLSDVVLLWAIVHSEERGRRNLAIPAGMPEVTRIVRKEATFKDLMLLSGNAQIELGCQMFLKREAGEDEKSHYSKQIAKGWPPSDALWKTISRKQSATFRNRKRILWKSICRPLTIGRWHLGRLLQFHVVRRLASMADLIVRSRQDLTAQIDAIAHSHMDLRQHLVDLQQRQQASLAGQFDAIDRAMQQWQGSAEGRFETIGRTLADMQQWQGSAGEQFEAIGRALADMQQWQGSAGGQSETIGRALANLRQRHELFVRQSEAIGRTLADMQQRQSSLGGQSDTIGRALANLLQRQESAAAQSEAICRTLADLQQQHGHLEDRTEVICQSVRSQEEEQKRLAANRRWQGQLVNDNVVLVEHPYGGVFGVPAENWGFVRMFTFDNGFERGTMSVLASLCQKDMTVVDIGAHVGLHSLVLARRVGPQGRVYCFEPCARSCGILRNNLFINDCGNVTVRETAISDYFGTCKFFVHDRELTWSSMYPLDNPGSCTEVSVETARLDDVIPADVKVDLVKIDAEGAELSILNGMQRIIVQNPMIQIILEFGPTNIARTGKRPEELIAKIRELGFSIRRIDETNGQLSPVMDEELLSVYSVNLLLSK